ncbi:MAG TPA: hypothetical protein VHB50_04105 [Bryobacteraceae bacterium]|nr:hypothetical protein [Bryobacteraceae bacterium]
MRETFLAKFGWEWESKIRIVNYGSELATVSSARPLKDRFRLEHNIPAERICVCVGNSASVGNQHLRVLAALARMSPEKLARLVVVVPMTYGATPAYLEQVRRAAQAHPATVVLLERFLTDAESAALRWSTDVLVHVPVSDQFSASMCESIYAGSVLITGAWLPYSRLRLAGIPYHELEDIACLPERLDEILDNIESERQKAIAAAPKMWDLMAWESVIPRWIRLYREILDKKENGDIECRQ